MSAEESHLEGRTAVVTGASSGIGLSIAKLFAESGARVHAIARRKEPVFTEAGEESAHSITLHAADVSNRAIVTEIISSIGESEGIDFLVCAAGINVSERSLEELALEDWEELVSTNGILNTKLYRALEMFLNLVYLNLLWLIACLPVLTAPAATAALFGVVRKWSRDEEPPVARTFVSLLRENFIQALGLGLLVAAVGVMLVADFLLVGRVESFRRPLQVMLLALSVLYGFICVYLFPVMVNFQASWKQVLKNSLLFSLIRPFTSLWCLAVLAIAVLTTVLVPLLVLVSGSLTAYALYYLCARTFREAYPSK